MRMRRYGWFAAPASAFSLPDSEAAAPLSPWAAAWASPFARAAAETSAPWVLAIAETAIPCEPSMTFSTAMATALTSAPWLSPGASAKVTAAVASTIELARISGVRKRFMCGMIAQATSFRNRHNGPDPPPSTRNASVGISPNRTAPLLSVLLIVLMSACTSTASPSQRPTERPSEIASADPSQSERESSLPTPAPFGFAFSVEAVIGYYEGRGFICDEVQPSATAAGHFYQGCEMEDADGRTLALGFVTDPSGDLADAYASVQAPSGEPFLEPTDALDHLAGFLGAMLGEDRGTSLLEWLAGHLGDAYAQTTIDTLAVATYTQSATDHSRLYLELADQDYINAPAPSAS